MWGRQRRHSPCGCAVGGGALASACECLCAGGIHADSCGVGVVRCHLRQVGGCWAVQPLSKSLLCTTPTLSSNTHFLTTRLPHTTHKCCGGANESLPRLPLPLPVFFSPDPTLPGHHVGTLVADGGLHDPCLAAHGSAPSLGERTCDVCGVCTARSGGRPGVVVSPLHTRGASARPSDPPPVPDPTCLVLHSYYYAPGPTETTTTNTPEVTNPSNDTAAGRR